MEDKRDSFVFYRSFYEATKRIPKRHQPVLYRAIFEYIFEQKEPQLESTAEALWISFKPQLDAGLKRYEDAKKGAKYGKLGGRPKKKDAEKKPLKGYENKTLNVNVNDNDNYNVNVNDNDNYNVNVNERVNNERNPKGFLNAPAVDLSNLTEKEVDEYIHAKAKEMRTAPDFTASKFLNYYNARGWMAGKTRITDWRAAVVSWLEHSGDHPPQYGDDDERPFG